MNITEIIEKIKDFWTRNVTGEIYIVAIIVLVAFASFGLGRLSVLERGISPVTIEYAELIQANTLSVLEPMVAGGMLVASKNGTKYHFPWCSGATRMKEENKIWFDSKEEAGKAGYEPARNCKGL